MILLFLLQTSQLKRIKPKPFNMAFNRALYGFRTLDKKCHHHHLRETIDFQSKCWYLSLKTFYFSNNQNLLILYLSFCVHQTNC